MRNKYDSESFKLNRVLTSNDSEVLLSVLLESFSFDLSETPIHWCLESVQYPYAGSRGQAGMPMKVKKIL